MKSNRTKERRKAPRVTKNVSLRLSKTNFDAITETKNLSCNGTYCGVSKYIEPLTRVKIIILIPKPSKRGKAKTFKIECDGIVVRTEESGNRKKPYNIAIYFNEIKEKDKDRISSYVEHHLAHQ